MVRLLHFSDLHLGVGTAGKIDTESGFTSRVLDALARLDDVVAFALENPVDVLIFSGDTFKHRSPDPTLVRDFARRIKKVSSAGVQVILLAGNHDMATVSLKATSLDIFRALEVENVTVVARQEVVVPLTLASGATLQVACYPYPMRQRLLVDDQQRGQSFAAQDEFFREQVATGLQRLAAQVDPARPAVLVAHLMVQGAQLGSEQRMILGMETDALVGNVALPVYDAVLLGHVHRHQVLRAAAPLTYYAGSLDRIDFGDEGQTKGFHLIEIDEQQQDELGRRRLTHQFIPVAAREFYTLDLDVRSYDDPLARVEAAIQQAQEAGLLTEAIVRVRVQCHLAQRPLLDATAIRRRITTAHTVTGIQFEAEQPTRTTAPSVPQNLTVPEALERYFIARGTSAKRRTQLMAALAELQQEEPPAL